MKSLPSDKVGREMFQAEEEVCAEVWRWARVACKIEVFSSTRKWER